MCIVEGTGPPISWTIDLARELRVGPLTLTQNAPNPD